MEMDDIGKMIRKARKKRKLSQSELAAIVRMSRSTISGIENGTVPEIGVRKILNICLMLSLEVIVQEKTRRPTMQQLMKESRHIND